MYYTHENLNKMIDELCAVRASAEHIESNMGYFIEHHGHEITKHALLQIKSKAAQLDALIAVLNDYLN